MNNLMYITAGLGVLVIIMYGIIINLWMNLSYLKKRYRKMMTGVDGANLERLLIGHIDEKLAHLKEHETLTIVMPQLVTKVWQMPLHNQTTLTLESALLERRDVAVVTIPYLIND